MPYSLAKVCGEDQEGAIGTQLAEPLVVLVTDEDGAAMAGVAVSFAVTAGGGIAVVGHGHHRCQRSRQKLADAGQ